MSFVVPKNISSDVRNLCRRIGGLGEPSFVPVNARKDSKPSNCFIDVENQVKEHGGVIQFGWTVWEWPGIVIQAEFHAVWKDGNSNLLDVAIKQDGETKILFVPDPIRVFENKRRDNFRLAVGRNPKIKEWIELRERFQKKVSKLLEAHNFEKPFSLEDEEAISLDIKANRIRAELMTSREARRAQS